jgi:WD40 repeat protein
LSAEFDVFLSHNGLDKPVVERIAEHLRREGLRPFLDIWDLTPGGRWQRELADGLSRSRTCALFVGPHAFGEWQLEELELALVRANQRDGFRVFPVLLPGVKDPFDAQQLPPFVSTRTWVDLRAGTAGRPVLQRLLNAIKGVAQGPATPAAPVSGVVPYRGLETFQEEHAEFFFGREREVQRLLEILKASPLVCVVGPSGSGKSSLVRAGLVPRLHNGALADVEEWITCLLRPGAHPLEALAVQLARLGGGGSMQATLDELAADRRTLHLGVSLAVGSDAPGRRVLLVVDQLEEAFTLCGDEHERAQFFANLVHAAFASGGRTVVVLTMRADFYARCAAYPELAERTARSLALVGPMDGDELRQAIEEPARRVGLFFEPGLVQTILADVGPDAGALPLLEHALLEVWRRRVGDELTLDGYVEAGRVEGALAKRAEGVFAGFTLEQQEVARRTMLRLTQPGEGTEDTRRRATISELTAERHKDAFDAVLHELVDERLLTTSGTEDAAEPVVEVSHEALTRGWPRLRAWIDAAGQDLVVHRRLTEATAEWARLEHDDSALYRGARLGEAHALRERDPEALNDAEHAFLDASSAREEDARRKELDDARALAAAQRRAKRGLIGVAAVLLAGIVAATTLTFVAFRARDDAERQRDQALSQQLGSAAVDTVAADPELALLLAREAADRAQTPQAEEGLRAVLGSPLEAVIHVFDGHDISVDFSHDGRTAAFSTGLEAVQVWDLERRRLIMGIDPHLGVIQSVALSVDGSWLLVAGRSGVGLWDARTGASRGRLPSRRLPDLAGVTCAFTPSSRRAACLDGIGLRLWDVRTRAPLASPQFARSPSATSVEPRGASALAEDGSVAALGSDRGAIRLFDLENGRIVRSIRGRGTPLASLQLNPTGVRMLAVSSDGTATVRRTDGTGTALRARLPVVRGGDAPGVADALLHPSGRMLVVLMGSEKPRLEAWNLATGARRKLRVEAGELNGISFAPDGRLAVVGGWTGRGDMVDLVSGSSLGALRPIGTADIISAKFAPAGGIVVTTDSNGVAELWRPGITMLADSPASGLPAFDPTGRLVAAADGSTLGVWEGATARSVGLPSRPLPTTGGTRVAATFAGGRERLLAALKDNAIHDIDLARKRDRITPLRGSVASIATTGVFVTLDKRSNVLDVRKAGSGELAFRILGRGPDPMVAGFAIIDAKLSPDGRRLAVSMNDGTAEVWDVARHARLDVIHPRDVSRVGAIAIRSDGRVLAMTDRQDGGLAVYDLVTKRSRKLSDALEDGGGWLSFSPDGRLLIVEGDSSEASAEPPPGRAYDAATGRLVSTFQLGPAVAVAPDSASVAISGPARPTLIQRCDECGRWEQLVERARSRPTGRRLSSVERHQYLGEG